MKVFMKPPKLFWIFLLKNSRQKLGNREIERQADYVELPLRLIMHGIPERLVKNATPDQLLIMAKVVERDIESTSASRANNIGGLFGGSDK